MGSVQAAIQAIASPAGSELGWASSQCVDGVLGGEGADANGDAGEAQEPAHGVLGPTGGHDGTHGYVDHHLGRVAFLEVLKLSGKQKFTEAVAELVCTSSEARMCLYFMSDIDWSEYLGWKHDVLVERCREFMPVA